MKKLYLFATICAIVFASCSDENADLTASQAFEKEEALLSSSESRAVSVANGFIRELSVKTRSGSVKEVASVYPWLTSDLYPQTLQENWYKIKPVKSKKNAILFGLIKKSVNFAVSTNR